MRTISPAAQTALDANHCQPFYMVSMECTSGTLYVWTGLGSITWDGHLWQGVGALGGVSPITATSEVTAENVTLSLSGIDPSLVEIALNETRQNFPAEVFLGFLDETNQVIVDPVKCFAGHVDVPTVQDGGDSCTISITCENPLVDLQRAANRRYTSDDQALSYPGDDGFMFVPGCQQWNGTWGKPA